MARVASYRGQGGDPGRALYRRIAVVLLLGAVAWRFWLLPGLLKVPASLNVKQTISGEAHLSLLGIVKHDVPINVEVRAKAVGQPGNQVKIVESLQFNTAISDSLLLREGLDILLRYATLQTEYAQALRYFFGTDTITSTFWVNRDSGAYIAPEAANGKRWIIPPSSAWPETYESWQVGLGRGTRFVQQPSIKSGVLVLERYAGDLGEYNIGTVQIPALGERVRLDSRGSIELRFERESHVLTGFSGELKLAAQIAGAQVDFLTIRLQMEEEAQAKLRWQAGMLSMLIRLGRDGLPLAFGLGALYIAFFQKSRKK